MVLGHKKESSSSSSKKKNLQIFQEHQIANQGLENTAKAKQNKWTSLYTVTLNKQILDTEMAKYDEGKVFKWLDKDFNKARYGNKYAVEAYCVHSIRFTYNPIIRFRIYVSISAMLRT